MHNLKRFALTYLATPYTKYPHGHYAAFEDACKISAALMKLGVSVFSPVVHAHPIAVHGVIDKCDHEFWMEVNRPFMEMADALIVAELDGWKQSDGVAEETATFFFAGKPIFHLDPETLAVRRGA